jgi:phosphoglycerate kinase
LYDKLSEIKGFEKENIYLLENLYNIKDEVANCLKYARELSSGVDIFVNDSFSNSHKVLASTVGVTRFCYACLAGFHFEEKLHLVKNLAEANKKPYVAIVCLFCCYSISFDYDKISLQDSLKFSYR